MSNWLLRFVFVLFTILAGSAAIAKDLPKEEQMIVRIAEIQVDRSQLEEYLKQARTVGAESVSKEPRELQRLSLKKSSANVSSSLSIMPVPTLLNSCGHLIRP